MHTGTFEACAKRRDRPPLVNHFHHPKPVTTLVGSPQCRNLFQINGLATGRKAPYGITAVRSPLPCSQGSRFVYWRPGQKRVWRTVHVSFTHGVDRQSSLLALQVGPDFLSRPNCELWTVLLPLPPQRRVPHAASPSTGRNECLPERGSALRSSCAKAGTRAR